jgi:hypothetical protein
MHAHQIVHRDLKPTNILFKGGVLKICDMGQSRVLAGGISVAQTESRGGTEGWRSPEELSAEVRMLRQGDGGVFESRLSIDIHPAASLMFYILTGGVHAFGEDYREQQTNVMKGWPINLRRLVDNPAACDLFLRMTSVEPKLRLTIEQARRHPALWDAETKLKMVCDWAKSWERGAALQQKLERHAAAVAGMLGQGAEGWLAKLDEPVWRRLLAHRHYDGREVTHLLQAVRTTHRLLRCAHLPSESIHLWSHQLCLDLRVGRPRSDRWPRAGAQHRGALVQAGDGGGRGGARAAHGLRHRGDAARAGLGRRGRAAGGGGGAVLPLRGAVRRLARGLPHARRLRVNRAELRVVICPVGGRVL